MAIIKRPMSPLPVNKVETGNEAVSNFVKREQPHDDFGKKIIMTLVALLLVYVIVYIGLLSRNVLKKYDFIGRADSMEKTIIITGMGKVTGNNDVAVTTIGYSNIAKEVSTAQLENKKVMDAVMKDLEALGVEEKDLQTSYTIYPEYNYTQDKGQELTGYRVSNQVTVKIRDLSKIPEVLGLAGKHNANQVNGLSFTIDDTENLKSEARAKALVNAKEKALILSQSLGVKLGAVLNYNEYDSGSGDYYPVMSYYKEASMGMGGGAPEQVASGSRDIIMNVNITFEILPL